MHILCVCVLACVRANSINKVISDNVTHFTSKISLGGHQDGLGHYRDDLTELFIWKHAIRKENFPAKCINK